MSTCNAYFQVMYPKQCNWLVWDDEPAVCSDPLNGALFSASGVRTTYRSDNPVAISFNDPIICPLSGGEEWIEPKEDPVIKEAVIKEEAVELTFWQQNGSIFIFFGVIGAGIVTVAVVATYY